VDKKIIVFWFSICVFSLSGIFLLCCPFNSRAIAGNQTIVEHIPTFYAEITNDEEALRLARAQNAYAGKLYLTRDKKTAFQNFLKTKLLLEKFELQSNASYALALREIADIYYDYRDYKNANRFYQLWEQQNDFIDLKPENTYNSYGVSYYQMQMIDSAFAVFDRGLDFCDKQKRPDWRITIMGNMALLYESQNQIEETVNQLNLVHDSSLVQQDYERAIHALLFASLFLGERGDWSYFERKQHEISQLIDNGSYVNEELFLSVSHKYNQSKGNLDAAYKQLEKYQQLNDSINRLVKDSDLNKVELSESIKAVEQELSTVSKAKSTISKVSITGLTFAVLIISIFSFITIKYIKRKKRELKLLNMHKAMIKKRLNEAMVRLEQSFDEIAKQKELIQYLESQKETNQEIDGDKEKIVNDLSHTKILTSDDWRDFKSLFNVAYPNFITNILNINRETSEAELRMACMIRLNLSNEQIGNMLGISKDSARKTSLRLRERLHMLKSSHEDLVAYIFSIEA
jgi:hypothetical protein